MASNDLPPPLNPLDQGPANALLKPADSVDFADAYTSSVNALSGYMAKQRAEGVANGFTDPVTGWPTQAGILNAVRQYGWALVGGTIAPGRPAAPVEVPSLESAVSRQFAGGRTMYHGTNELSTSLADPELYLIDHPGEAAGYAAGSHWPGSGAPAKPAVVPFTPSPGKSLDINGAIADGMANDYDPGEVISAAIEHARATGHRYIEFDHPAFSGGPDARAVISLHPGDDLGVHPKYMPLLDRAEALRAQRHGQTK